MRLLTETFGSESAMNSFISEKGITRDKISYMGKLGDKFMVSWWSIA